jgi:NAD(P)-dependent dehydrogenase (short-subunit alcohol dehydrogenase family)
MVVEPDGPPPGSAGEAGISWHRSPDKLPESLAPEAVVLAVKPQVVDDVLPFYRRWATPQTLFVSIVAGKTIAGMTRHLGPAALIRTMPNTPAAIGRGITVACANERVTAAQRRLCDRLLAAVGDSAWVEDEALLDAVTAVSGSGPAYVFLLIEALAEAAEAAGGKASVRAVGCDVSRLEDVERLREEAYGAFGEVGLLMNNAGIGNGGGPWEKLERWRRILEVNLWGVIHGVQVFAPRMIAAGKPGAIVNTGSKQGITTPPGDAAYNVSKAGVKVVTEQLAHGLRNAEGAKVTAHLLIPGFTFTGITSGARTEKPAAAWSADQVVDFMLPALARGDFYILCPDNETTRAMDEKRMRWAADDVILNRPALSRWHSDYKESFAAFMQPGKD